MNKGRPKNSEAFTKWKLHVPVSVAAVIENMIYDDVNQKPGYGLRSRLVTVLLKKYIAEHQGEGLVQGLTASQIERLEGEVND